MEKNNVIEIRNLTKKFGNLIAVDNISMDIIGGKITGILGGNGAGKTTTITMMLGLLLPTTGSIKVLSKDVVNNRYSILHRINFSSPYVDLPKKLTVLQNLKVYSMLYGVNNSSLRIQNLARDLNFQKLLKKKTGDISSGQITRILLAKSLLNEPEILFLDEPTASLDPDMGDKVRGYLQKYQKETKSTILLTSHNMDEVKRLCDEVLMMKNGKIVDQGSPNQVISRHGKNNLEEVFLKIARED